MERSEAYAYIKKHDLKDAVESRYGTNYTRTTTAKLEEFVNWHKSIELSAGCSAHTCDCRTETASTDAQEVNNAYEAACLTFLGILKDAGLLDELLEKL